MSLTTVVCVLLLALPLQVRDVSLALASQMTSSILEDLNYEATFRLQTFASAMPQSIGEVHEHYQSSLQAASIRLLVHELDHGQLVNSQALKYLYHSPTRLLLEVRDKRLATGSRNVEFFHRNNGGSENIDFASSASTEFDLRLVRTSQPVDSKLLLIGESNSHAPLLDLTPFFRPDCLQFMDKKLPHIKGVSRLILLVECRRNEFKLKRVVSKSKLQTRGINSLVYEADNLAPVTYDGSLNEIHRLSLTLTIQLIDRASVSWPELLPENFIPLSIGLAFDPELFILINVYQFATLEANEHLSDTPSGQSVYLMPLLSGASDLLRGANGAGSGSATPADNQATARALNQQAFEQYSFEAQLSQAPDGNPSSASTRNEPVKVRVVYDASSALLAIETTSEDRTKSLGDTYNYHVARLVYDGRARKKFHLMSGQLGYQHSATDDDVNLANEHWQTCAEDSTSNDDLARLNDAAEDVLSLHGAVFMGMARVRGIACYVFEKRIYNLPLWLKVHPTETLSAQGINVGSRYDQMYADLYVKASQLAAHKFAVGQFLRLKDEKQPQPVRLDVRMISDDKNELNYRLDIKTFDWSISANQDFSHWSTASNQLLDVAQDCLLTSRRLNGRAMQLHALYKPESASGAALETNDLCLLRDNEEQRRAIVSRGLDSSYGVGKLQQLNLQTTWLDNNHLRVELDVYELPEVHLAEKFVGFERDLTKSKLVVGVKCWTYEECKWRAAHLISDSRKNSPILFLFCPNTFKCFVDEKDWTDIIGRKSPESALRQTSSVADPGDHQVCVMLSVTKAQNKPNIPGQSASLRDGKQDDHRLLALSQLEQRISRKPLELRVNEHLVSMEPQLVSLRPVVANDDHHELKGIAYDELQPHLGGAPQSADPIYADNPFECSASCLQSHLCGSYSICHERNKIASTNSRPYKCIFSSIKLSRFKSTRFAEQLRAAERASDPAIDVSISRKDDLTDWNSNTGVDLAKVRLVRSNLCSMRGRDHLDVYRFASSLREPIPASAFLIYATSASQCATFCLERAQLVRELRDWSQSFNGTTVKLKACDSFVFNHEFSYCELLPRNDYRPLMSMDIKSTASRTRLNRWLRWVQTETPIQWAHNTRLGFSEGDRYELDYEKLFYVSPNLRLTSLEATSAKELTSKSPESQNSVAQVTMASVSLRACAHHCIISSVCHSFDYKPGADLLSNATNASICQLNPYADPSQDSETLKRPNWWLESVQDWLHFAPNELAEYTLLIDGLHSSSTSSSEWDIFIKVEASGRLSNGNNRQLNQSNYDRKTIFIGLTWFGFLTVGSLVLVALWAGQHYLTKIQRRATSRETGGAPINQIVFMLRELTHSNTTP